MESDQVICEGCKNEIDPDVCGCGDAIKDHGYDNGHAPIPMGCDCLRRGAEFLERYLDDDERI
jgi:hypothetical protein